MEKFVLIATAEAAKLSLVKAAAARPDLFIIGTPGTVPTKDTPFIYVAGEEETAQNDKLTICLVASGSTKEDKIGRTLRYFQATEPADILYKFAIQAWTERLSALTFLSTLVAIRETLNSQRLSPDQISSLVLGYDVRPASAAAAAATTSASTREQLVKLTECMAELRVDDVKLLRNFA